MRIIHALMAVFCVVVSLPTQPARAQGDRRCFREVPGITNCIEGRFREYWEQNGGLAVFGYPTTSVAIETNADGFTGPTQWFERDRLEDHNAEGKGILAGRLGAVRFKQIYGTEWNE